MASIELRRPMSRFAAILFAVGGMMGSGLVLAGGGHAAALGMPSDPAKATRSIEVDMTDAMRFVPDRIEIKSGETIRFQVKNSGQMAHEFVLGTAQKLRRHAEWMRQHPEMEHDDPNAIKVDPGKTAELIWHFNHVGTFDFACLVPGHFEAGMAGKIIVRR